MTLPTPTLEQLSFLQQLAEMGYRDARVVPGNRWAGTQQFMYTNAIIVGRIGDSWGYDDRWCYSNHAAALRALDAWDGTGEPQGWHRHPGSGRRRPNGDQQLEFVNP